MKIIIAGMGNQGIKRGQSLKGKSLLGFVDPYKKKADYKKIEEVPIDKYDTIFICTNEKSKLKLVNFCIKNKKNFLIEKPFPQMSNKNLKNIIKKILKARIIAYVAYNLRFENNILKLKKKISNTNKIYSIELEYSNGTAANIKKNKWRDKNLGVISDLGCHLVDILIFLFGNKIISNKPLCIKNNFENNSIDHSLIVFKKNKKLINIKNSYCSWKNFFKINIVSRYYNYKLFSLEKWGDTKLLELKRIFPSGVPVFKDLTVKKKYNNVFNKELVFFKKLLKYKNYKYIKKEIYINKFFNDLKFL